MKLRELLVLIVVVALASFVGTIMFYSFYQVKEVKLLPYDFEVGDHIGFNVDPTGLHFGLLTPKGGSKRGVDFYNDDSIPIEVRFRAFGDLADSISYSDNNFIMLPGENRYINFSASIPPKTEMGNYTGHVRAMFVRI